MQWDDIWLQDWILRGGCVYMSMHARTPNITPSLSISWSRGNPKYPEENLKETPNQPWVNPKLTLDKPLGKPDTDMKDPKWNSGRTSPRMVIHEFMFIFLLITYMGCLNKAVSLEKVMKHHEHTSGHSPCWQLFSYVFCIFLSIAIRTVVWLKISFQLAD